MARNPCLEEEGADVSFRDVVFGLIRTTRPQQWYKNLLVFVGATFALKLGDVTLYPRLALGFLLLCAVSGTGYVINDIRDIEKDRLHPEKGHRPIPSGIVSVRLAVCFSLLLSVISIVSSFYLDLFFGVMVFALFITHLLYNFYLRDVIFVDVTMISFGYIWRALSGCYLVAVSVSQWLFLCTFLLALMLALGKRKSELISLGEAYQHRPVFQHYTNELLNQSLAMVASMLLVSYSLYSFLAETRKADLMITVPLVIYLALRYMYLLYSGNPSAGKPERILFDKHIVVGVIIWVILIILSLYVVT